MKKIFLITLSILFILGGVGLLGLAAHAQGSLARIARENKTYTIHLRELGIKLDVPCKLKTLNYSVAYQDTRNKQIRIALGTKSLVDLEYAQTGLRNCEGGLGMIFRSTELADNHGAPHEMLLSDKRIGGYYFSYIPKIDTCSQDKITSDLQTEQIVPLFQAFRDTA